MLTPKDFNVPTSHPFGMLSGKVSSHTSEKESVLAYILGLSIEANPDSWEFVQTSNSHPTMVSDGLLVQDDGENLYKLTKLSIGLLYSFYGK